MVKPIPQAIWKFVWTAVVLGTAACGGGSSPTSPSATTVTTSTASSTSTTTPATPSTTAVTWSFNGTAWRASGTAPACGTPLTFNPPLDMTRVTSVLYPGQARPDYKAHGGLRLDGPGQTNDVIVTAPETGYLYRGARYLVSGELQYELDFVNPCGVMHRLGHLRSLSPRFDTLAATLPAAAEGDSRTTVFPPGQTVAAGETIATAIGLRATNNVFMDWGVYDLRAVNQAASNPSWLAAHPGELEPFAICWLDHVAGFSGLLRSLPPGDPTAGRTSDYCR